MEQDVPAAVYQHPDGNKTQIHLASATQIDWDGRGFRNSRISVQAEAAQGAAAAAAAEAANQAHLSKAWWSARGGGASEGSGHTLQRKHARLSGQFPFEGTAAPRLNNVEDWSRKRAQRESWGESSFIETLFRGASRNIVGVKYKLITAEAHLQAISGSKTHCAHKTQKTFCQ